MISKIGFKQNNTNRQFYTNRRPFAGPVAEDYISFTSRKPLRLEPDEKILDLGEITVRERGKLWGIFGSYPVRAKLVKLVAIRKKIIFSNGKIPVEDYRLLVGEDIIGTLRLFKDKFDKTIKVEHLKSWERRKYKGVGSKLLQLAIERSFQEGFSGCVSLKAHKIDDFSRHPKKFYEKMGFIESVDDRWAKMKKDFGYPMELTPDNAKRWLDIISRSPVLKDKPE